ncbi:hypothetical protein PRZ48_006014 [Zasmidium cellare]|uniref:Saccharopine dehydrogenase NADP binding domain-containing protein n=1 Tax=Zasmidium cellare TaxID=395010 RepID=A0ABR0EN96_ZASCE|nr:hypothetical protein PRZ48_006014 [Zasmidium cellare]
MAQTERQYEVVVFGATGYTGKYAAEHLTTNAPTDLKWAIAGRSQQKLEKLAGELRAVNPDRQQPGIEIASLSKDDLVKLAKKTKVLISTVGPYHRYGTHAFEACAENGTHYLDCTGEVPWVYDMVQKYESKAKKTGAIMIPQNGVESAPTDLMCWMLATHIRRALSVGTAEVVDIMYDIKGTPSGGTLDTVLTLFDSYSLRQIAKSMSPFSLCSISPPQQKRRKPLLEILTGIRNDNDLGLLTTSLQGPTDAPIVNRTWSLLDGGRFYGKNFQLSPYMRAKGTLHALIVHFALTFGTLALILPPVRWIIKRFVYQPGEGPTREQAKREYCEWRAIANADVTDPNDPKRAYGSMRWEGSMYHLTAVFLCEAAMTMARDKTAMHALKAGGILTPGALANSSSYLERLQKAGLQTEVKFLPQ